jgi:acyl carrier protein
MKNTFMPLLNTKVAAEVKRSFDSMSLVEFILEVEQEFGLKIPEAAAEQMRTLRDVIGYVSQAKRPSAA